MLKADRVGDVCNDKSMTIVPLRYYRLRRTLWQLTDCRLGA